MLKYTKLGGGDFLWTGKKDELLQLKITIRCSVKNMCTKIGAQSLKERKYCVSGRKNDQWV
jgi:hypothetical protein